MTKYVSLDNLTRYDGQIKNIINSNIIQYSTMPTASADTVDKIVQYIGTTTNDYTNGYFYKGVSETENDVTTYSWSNVEVQDSASEYSANSIFINTGNRSGQDFGKIIHGNTATSVYLNADEKEQLTDFLQSMYDGNKDMFSITIGGDYMFINENRALSMTVSPQYLTGRRLSEKPTQMTCYSAMTSCHVNNDMYMCKYRLAISLSWDGDIVSVTSAFCKCEVALEFITSSAAQRDYLRKDNTASYTPTSNYHPATKKYVDDAVASAGSSVPTITIAVSQIVSQDPIQISLTAEQQAIIEDANIGTLIIDGSALGVTPAHCQKNEDGSTDVLLAAFSFDWDLSSGFKISNTRIFVGHYDKQTHILTIVNTPLLGSTPTADNHLANKKYVDDAVAELTTTIEDTATNNDIDSLFN